MKSSSFAAFSIAFFVAFICFSMSIGLDGYPFQKPDWMIGKNFRDIRKDSEINEDFFVDICKKLYNEEYAKMKQVV